MERGCDAGNGSGSANCVDAAAAAARQEEEEEEEEERSIGA
jgi:hypothetical protein